MDLDKSKLSVNPLEFWKQHQELFPVLTLLARQIYCIPASLAAVERSFSSSGFILNERLTSLHPNQFDNITVVRSMEKLKKLIIFLFICSFMFGAFYSRCNA